MDIHVVDSNIFIHGKDIELPFENMLTVPEVTGELESEEAINRFESEDVGIEEPSDKALKEVRKKALELNSDVSNTDLKLVSLAKEKKCFLVTDDYHMQNLADKIGIRWKGFLKEGIEESYKWKKICSDCGREIKENKCQVCGGSPKISSS